MPQPAFGDGFKGELQAYDHEEKRKIYSPFYGGVLAEQEQAHDHALQRAKGKQEDI